jgi:hypothetical protein
MGFMDEYNKLKKKKKSESEDDSSKGSFLDEYNKLKSERESKKHGNSDPLKSFFGSATGALNKSVDMIQSVPSRTKKAAKEKIDFFDKGALDDGFSLENVGKTVLGTLGDVGVSVGKGVGRVSEGIADLIGYGMAYGAEGLAKGAKKVGLDDLAWDLEGHAIDWKYAAEENVIDDFTQDWDKALDENSILGNTSQAILEGVGQVGTIAATGGLGELAGLGQAGIQLLTYGTMFGSSMGSGIGEAYKGGATDEEAATYGLIAGASDTITEMIFGGLGKSLNIAGFGKGLSSADDMLAKKVSGMFSNQIAKNFAEFGIKAGAEGFEEVLAGTAQAIGKSITYMKAEHGENYWEHLGELLEDENLLEQFVVASVTSGIMQSGVIPTTSDPDTYDGSLIKANKTGRDFITGFTANDQTVFDKVVEDRIAEQEKNGKKLTRKEKAAIEAEVQNDLEKGYITTDTIESILGGETYKAYKDTLDKENALVEQQKSLLDEFNKLGSKENPTLADQTRYADLSKQLQDLQSQIDNPQSKAQQRLLKAQLSKSVYELTKNDRLRESYFEVVRGQQKFEADLSKYKGRARDVIQKVMDSKLADNSNQTHEFWDWAANMSSAMDTDITLANDEQILDMVRAEYKENGWEFDESKFKGQRIDGYASKNGIVLNASSKRALNFVVGHEITHKLEKTKHYGKLQELLFEYAKDEYESRYNERKGQYSNKLEADENFKKKIDQEVTGDLVGDYIFNDKGFIDHLTKDRNVFQRVWDEVKAMAKIATAGSEQAKQLEKVKREFERAYREMIKAQNANKNGGVQLSISETTDGRLVAVVDDDILSNIDTSSWDDTKKAEAKKAAADALKQFSDGIVVDGITRNVNRVSRREYTRSNYTEKLYKQSPDIFADKMRAADVADDIVVAATGWNRDGGLKHPRSDNFVDFDHGRTLIASGNAKYVAEVVVGITDTGEAVFYDVVDMQPTTFDIKKSESPTTATTQDAIGDIQGDSFNANVPQKGDSVKGQFSLSDSDGRQLTQGQQEYFKDSKVRDENGNLLTVYHTTNSDFTVFDKSKQGEATHDSNTYMGFFFSDDAEYLQNFPVFQNGKTDAYYLNVKNPIDMTDISRDAFLDIVEALGGDVDTAADVYEEVKLENGNEPVHLIHMLQETGADATYSDLIEELKPHYSELMAKGYDGVINHLSEYRGVKEYIVLDSNQAKLTSNANPTADPDIRYSVSEVTDAQNEQGLDAKSEVSFSLSNDTAYMDKAIAANNSNLRIDSGVMANAKAIREQIAARMNAIKDRGLVGLPEDIEGNTYITNSSYDGTEENTTICPRSLASEAFTDAVSEYLGRPLTVEEQIYISQDLQGRSLTPECTYCYVATDRKAYRAFLGEYINQRDAVLQKVQENPGADVSRSGELYKEFLNGRKDTEPMYKRFKMWVDAYKNGTPMVEASHLANINKLMGDINSEFGAELKPQIVDAMKYAQSASWAKKRVNYVAYNGHILKWKQDRINKLNSHYGLRMYSFSDFHPAFVLENMQMITDASVRGLKMLGYTKDTDFVEIFAPSGMNINVSTFGFEVDGNVYENNIIGAEWEKAKALREQHPNVGITFVATNDTLVNWALEQDWIDVVIPYHLVRTGAEVAKAFNYTNYTSESSDTKDAGWTKGTDKKYIAPTEHNNDKATYLAALEKNHLKPRFERFLDNPNYMKLVNECRQSASESKPVQPVFNEDAAMVALAKLEANGYYQPIGGSVDRMYEIAAEVAENMAQELAPTMSLSDIGQNFRDTGGYKYYSSYATPATELRFEAPVAEDIAPVAETPVAEAVEFDAPIAEKYEAIRPKREPQPRMVRATPEEQARMAKILFEHQQTPKQKSAWKWAREHIFSRGAVFEDMSLKTGNRELQAKFDNIRRAESRAQTFIGKGKGNAKALVDVRKAVEDAGKTEDFNYYLYHLHNVDRMTLEQRFKDVPNKSVFGDSVDAEVSRKAALGLEVLNPEFKQWAEDVYSINKHLRQMMVSEGIISQETADLWQKMYPHYVPISRADANGLNVSVPLDTKRTGINAPIKKATGGNSDFYNVFDTMGGRIEQTFKAIAKNRFGVELMNTLGTAYESDVADIDTVLEAMDQHEELLQEGKNGESPSFTVFQNGERMKFAITEDMYDAMKPSQFTYTNKALKKINDIRRDILTTYSPTFALTNPIKDVQDILMNSQHPARTYATIPEAIYSVISKNEWYQERMENGGNQDSYFDGQTKTFKKEDGLFKKVMGFVPSKIQAANEIIEQVPRMAEYIASRKMGRSIDVSMLDAARVTTNFGAPGDLTNMLNRNGFTFLGASVEGFNQQVRNVREAKAEGAKGWAKLAGKCLIAGLPALLLNHVLWDDDEEYEELSDYVKQNYYVVAKTEDGKFIRIPKGRAVAVIQDAFKQMENLITGDDDVDLESFGQLVINNLAPNNPLENNIIAPIVQAYTNKTWYGDDLVPTRLQDVPVAEQFDETTDSISKWLGETFNISPYKANYLLDQYTGGVGDMALPYLTPEADGGGLGAAFRDKFVTDPVLKNQNVTDFYDKVDELTVNANSSKATDDDILMSKYMSSVSSEIGKLYQQKREIQNGDLSDAKKYAEVRAIQQQIDDLAENALGNYDDIKRDGDYAKIGDVYFQWYKPEDGDPYWRKLSESQTTKYLLTKDATGHYVTDGKVHYRLDDDGEWTKISDKQLELQNEVTKALGITPEEYWSKTDISFLPMSDGEYEYAYDNPENYAVAKAVGGYDSYRKYSSELYNIKADKDKNGKSISGSRKEKVIKYINNLDADYGEKIILYKSEYPSDDTYNVEIVEYLNGREDISYKEMETILKELGFEVDKDGNISW